MGRVMINFLLMCVNIGIILIIHLKVEYSPKKAEEVGVGIDIKGGLFFRQDIFLAFRQCPISVYY